MRFVPAGMGLSSRTARGAEKFRTRYSCHRKTNHQRQAQAKVDRGDIYHGEPDLSLEWMVLRVSFLTIIAFHGFALWQWQGEPMT